jgi:hypothetical protein
LFSKVREGQVAPPDKISSKPHGTAELERAYKVNKLAGVADLHTQIITVAIAYCTTYSFFIFSVVFESLPFFYLKNIFLQGNILRFCIIMKTSETSVPGM